jgi:predicted transposase YdaD
MAYRMIDYYVSLRGKYPDYRIVQIVVYLRKTNSERVFANYYQNEKMYHKFEVVRLWEPEPKMLMGLSGFVPLVVLSKTNDQVGMLRRVAKLIERIPDR